MASIALAAVRSARLCATLATNVLSSMTASSSPAFTSVLKSALSSLIWPDSCEPTLTVTSARTGPEVETNLRIGP